MVSVTGAASAQTSHAEGATGALPSPAIAAVRRPDIGPQPAHDREQRGLALGGDLALQCLARTRRRIHSRIPAAATGRTRGPVEPLSYRAFSAPQAPQKAKSRQAR